jgi:hypothetical protein
MTRLARLLVQATATVSGTVRGTYEKFGVARPLRSASGRAIHSPRPAPVSRRMPRPANYLALSSGFRLAGLWTLRPIFGPTLPTVLDSRGIKGASHNMVANARQILHAAATN